MALLRLLYYTMSVLASEFNPALVSFGEVKTLSSGAKSVPVTYNGNALIMQMTNLELPYGLNKEDKFGPTKFSVNLSLRGYDSDPKVQVLYQALLALDSRTMKESVEKNWLKKPGITEAILSQMKLYKPTVKFAEDPDGNRKPWPPTVKAALRKNSKSGEFEAVFYDADRKEIPSSTPVDNIIARKMTATALVECTGAWISSAGCGLSWKVNQFKTVKYAGMGRGYAFKDEEGEQSTPAPVATSTSKFEAAFDDEEDEEDLVGGSATPAPPVPEAPKKVQTVMKKKVIGSK